MAGKQISQAFIQELHDRIDIEDVISSHVTLTKAGKNLKGLCPFHNEKTASFTVYPDTKSFYCFGCGAGGDVLSFIMRIENLDYVEAVKQAADIAGLAMPDDGYDDSFAKERLRLLNANREAAKYFNKQLLDEKNRPALEYFLRRGLTPATITHFGLGYAPNDWHAMTNHLKSLGFTENELVLANLSRRQDGKSNCYDNFRNRMMFPIIDLRGNVVAFSGRRLNEEDRQKYVNTSDTPVYKKGNSIFGLNFAKNTSDKKLIIVEGQMDVIALHQAGFTNAVACLGTALTTEQANILSRYADELLICYDSDEAGKKATARALGVLGKTGLKLKVINMEGGKDPDEIIRTYGKERFNDLINGAANQTEYRLNSEMSKYNVTTDDGRLKFLSAAAVILAECGPIEREVYVLRLCNDFGISREAMDSQIKIAESRLRRNQVSEREKQEAQIMRDSFSDKNNPQRENNLRAAKAEEVLIASLMRNPDFYRKIKDKFTPEDFITDFNRRVITYLIDLIENNVSTDLTMFARGFTPAEMDSITRIAMTARDIGNTVKECEDCINVLKSATPAGSVDPSEMSDEEFLKLFKKKN